MFLIGNWLDVKSNTPLRLGISKALELEPNNWQLINIIDENGLMFNELIIGNN